MDMEPASFFHRGLNFDLSVQNPSGSAEELLDFEQLPTQKPSLCLPHVNTSQLLDPHARSAGAAATSHFQNNTFYVHLKVG